MVAQGYSAFLHGRPGLKGLNQCRAMAQLRADTYIIVKLVSLRGLIRDGLMWLMC